MATAARGQFVVRYFPHASLLLATGRFFAFTFLLLNVGRFFEYNVLLPALEDFFTYTSLLLSAITSATSQQPR